MPYSTASPVSVTQLKNTLLAAGILLVLNVGFLGISKLTGVDRTWVNLDYAFVLVVCAFGFQTLAVVFGLLFLLTDTLTLISQLFPFPRLSDLVYLLKFTALTSNFHLLIIAATTTLILGKLASLVIMGKRITPLSSLIVLNTLVAAAIIFGQFGNTADRIATYRQLVTPVVASQTLSLIKMRSAGFLDHFENDGDAFTLGPTGATLPWHDTVDHPSHDRLLLVVVESWGASLIPEIEHALLAPLRTLPTASFERGNISVEGFTIAGELRELCKLAPVHFNLRDVKTGFESCLPNRLQAAGYATAAIHGATSLMYDRRHWYPRVGFQEMTFFEDKRWPRRCHSFPGACDLDMVDNVSRFFSHPGKRFLYWLTLNSHAPFDLRDLRTDHFDCAAYGIGADTESCRMLKLQADFFAGLAQQLGTDAMKDVEVIIVGDHPPKLLNLEEKRKNFSMNSVPWIRLKTKGS